VDVAAFDTACGVGASFSLLERISPAHRAFPGFSATPEEVLSRVRAYVDSNKPDIVKLGWNGIGKTTGQMKTNDGLRWINTLELKAAVETVYEEVFGKKEDKAAATAKVKKARSLRLHWWAREGRADGVA
jgi:hypothetical protein